MSSIRTFIWTITVYCFIQLLTTSVAFTQDEATWTYPILDKSFEYYQDDWGNIVISEKGTITSLHPRTGETNWTLDTGSDKVTISPVEETPLIIVDGEKLQLVDVILGEIYLEDAGENVSYKKHEVFSSKNKIIIDYMKDDKNMVAVVDVIDFNNSIISEVNTKGHNFGINSRLPSSLGTVSKHKGILNCLASNGNFLHYDSGEKSMKIIGGTDSGIASIIVKDKYFKGVNMATCEVVWEYSADKRPKYQVSELDKVLLLIKSRSFVAIDMETGKEIYFYDEGEVWGQKTYFYNGYLYYSISNRLRKVDLRTGEIVLEKAFDSNVVELTRIDDAFYLKTDIGINRINLETMATQFDKGLIGDKLVWQENKGDCNYYVSQLNVGYIVHCYKSDSTLVWRKRIRGTKFIIAFLTDVGIVLATEEQFKQFLNKDGEESWSYKSKFNIAFDANQDSSRYYGIVSSYSFYIDSKTGEFTALPTFEFRDFDPDLNQSHILVHEDSYILKSGNNFYIRGKEGKEIVSRYYKPHSDASKIANIGAIAMSLASTGLGDVTEGIVQVREAPNLSLKRGKLKFSGKYGRALDASRRKITNSSDLNLPYVFTKTKDNKKIFIFLEPTTGDEYKVVEVEDEVPDYKVDNYEGILFYRNNKEKRLEAHMLSK